MDDPLSSLELDLSFSDYIIDFSSRHPNLRSLSLLTPGSVIPFDANSILGELVQLISVLETPGPYRSLLSRQLIGSGAQFRVFKEQVYFATLPGDVINAAIKIPRFMLDAETRLDISDAGVKRHIRSLFTEITALSHPDLRGHPNIVRLIGWGFDEGSWHAPPFLVLELASSDLQVLLDERTLQGWEVAQDVMAQIGSGLDAIHDVGLLHGDLKPGNVLMFLEAGVWVPRLADFGGAVGADNPSEFLCQGTMGWRAPELRNHHENGKPLDSSVLSAIDVWSYGLVLWSVLCGGDSPPLGSETDAVVDNALADVARQRPVFSDEIYDLLLGLLPLLLNRCPLQRPRRVEDLLTPHIADSSVAHDMRVLHLEADEETEADRNRIAEDRFEAGVEVDIPHPHFAWELPEIPNHFSAYLVSSFQRFSQSLRPAMTFSTFLSVVDSFRDKDHPSLLRFSQERAALLRQMLTACVDGGLAEARAIFFLFHESLELPVEPEYLGLEAAWAYEAICSGALFLSSGNALDRAESVSALRAFQETCGYNRYYSDTQSSTVDDALIPRRTSSDYLAKLRPHDLLHILASSSRLDALDRLKELATPENVNTIAENGDTMLYRACLSGCNATVAFLLSIGADPTICPAIDGPTCLHWIVTFLPEQMNTIICNLVSHGADMQAVCRTRDKLPHFPFQYPSGTPLHWALEFANKDAAHALLQNGADPLIRDGLQSITFSTFSPDFQPSSLDDIRPSVGGTHVGPIGGSTALDVAIRNWDADALEIMLRHLASPADASYARVEHLGAFHELIRGDWRWIDHYRMFCNRLIGGPQANRRRNLEKTIDLLKRFGFDVNRKVRFLDGERESTVLMLAVDLYHVEVTEALLDGGADPNIVDDIGQPALAYITGGYGLQSEEAFSAWKEQDAEMAALLLRYGANAGVSNRAGVPAVVKLMNGGRIGAVSTLLRSGADIAARHGDERQRSYGRSILSFLFRQPGGVTITPGVRDKFVAAFLGEHVLPRLAGPDGTQIPLRDHGLDEADPDGGTLIHYAASETLPRSCRVLLDAGADTNAVMWRRHSGSTPAFVTPVDLVIDARAYFRREMESFGHGGLSKLEMQIQARLFQETIELLRRQGGMEFSELASD